MSLNEAFQKLLSFVGVNRRLPVAMQFQVQQLGFAGCYFGLAGEDAALRQIFKRELHARKPGTYVDIGCNHPGFMSNTYLFYACGWRGLCVDADQDMAEGWATVRPEDTFVCSAVGSRPGAKFLVKSKTNEGNHYVQDTDAPRGPDFLPARPVTVRRLDDLFGQFIGDKRINLMSMDIEGGELDALESNDWTRWRPETIIMECWEFDFLAPKGHPAVAFLYDQGYRLRAKVGENVIMVEGR